MDTCGDKKVFDRVEKKCLISKAQKARILAEITKHLKKDEYHKSEVFNIYFDTKNNDLIQNSIEQPMFKAKLRARSYGGYDKVFLEIKTKIRKPGNNIGYKRRVRLTRKEYIQMVEQGAKVVELAGETGGNIAKEVDYLMTRWELVPKILVIYHRESYADGEMLRITFDERLKYRTEKLEFKKSKLDKKYFEGEKNIVMEIKAHDAWPLWLAQLLSQEKIFAQTFSKVGKIYEKIRKESELDCEDDGKVQE